jgi:signal transduction histidine kinase/FixJ family two-component response regulator
MSTPAPARLLIVDDESAHMRALCDILQQEGYVTRGFISGAEAVKALRQEPFDLLLTDLMMPQMDGIALLRACHEIDRDLACIVMTGHGTIATAVDALKAGALDYVLKPFKVNNIVPVLGRALAMRRLQLENIQLRESVGIYELAQAITQGLEHDDIVERTLAAAGRQSDAHAVCLLVPATDGRTLKLAGASGCGVDTLQDLAPAPAGALEDWVARARAELEAPDAKVEPAAPFAHPFDARVGLAIPIVAGGRCFGVLGFSSSRPQRRVSRGQLKALDVLACTAANAFATAALVTELRRMNEELEMRVSERTRELENANKELESFSYSISHDLREPLRAVEGFCEIFRTEFAAAVPAAGQRVLERIWAGASRMTRLIDDLLHFSRFSREPLRRERVRLHELALQIVARLKERVGARPIAVQVGELPDCYGDPALLEQVLMNLLSNAFKFTSGRDVARVEVGVLRQEMATVYYVRDNGVGFDMRYADKLFGVFQRLHAQEAFEGTGIGLSIVQRIVVRHGGKIWADSRPGEGATFYFSLPAPAEPRAAPSPGNAAAPTENPVPTEFTRTLTDINT